MTAQAHVDTPRRIRLLDAEPDIGASLAVDQRRAAAARSTVSAFPVRRGRWSLGCGEREGELLTLYVVSGVLTRRASVGARASIELLGPGDLLCPAADMGEETLAFETEWTALEPAWLAVLDDDFWSRLALWPEIVSALLRRAFRRARSLSLVLAISQCPGLTERLYLVLWHLADRYGYVESRGVMLPLHLPHAVLAELVSARRPSVSKPLRRLQDAGLITRLRGGSWLLNGRAPVSPRDVTSGGLFERAAVRLGQHADRPSAPPGQAAGGISDQRLTGPPGPA